MTADRLCAACGGPIPPDSSSERFCSRNCLLEELLSVLDTAGEMIEAMPVGPDGPIQGGFSMEELTVLMAMESSLADPLLDAAESGAMLTRILDRRMIESAKSDAVWRYPTPLEIRGDEAWATYTAFTKPT